MEPQDYIQLTLYPEASLDHASHFPSPGSEEAQRMTVTSGRKCLELSKSCGPIGLLEKMLLESSAWRSTLRLLTWKHKVTKQGRLYFQLAASAPRTKDTECLLWQTPNVPNGGRANPPEMSPTGKMPDGRKRQVGLEHQVKMVESGMWPTPRAKESGDYQYSQGDHNKFVPTLSGAVKMYATPQARDYRTGQTCRFADPQRSRNLNDQIGGQLNPDWVEWLMGFPIGWTDIGTQSRTYRA